MATKTQGEGNKIDFSGSGCKKRIRRRRVAHGNPSLGTHNGIVYTCISEKRSKESKSFECDIETYDSEIHPDDSEIDSCGRTVALVGVPPEHVPDGLINFARRHVPFVRHVRILLQLPETDSNSNKKIKRTSVSSEEILEEETFLKSKEYDVHSNADARNTQEACVCVEGHSFGVQHKSNGFDSPPDLSFVNKSGKQLRKIRDNNLTVRGEENYREHEGQKEKKISREKGDVVIEEGKEDGFDSSTLFFHESWNSTKKSRRDNESETQTYLVLFEFDCKESATECILDLHGKPYLFLKEDEVCEAYNVVPPLLNESGVSLMRPIFASTDISQISLTHPLQHTSPLSPRSHSKSFTFNEKISMMKKDDSSDSDYNCAVCLDIIGLTEACKAAKPILTTVCNHTFHLECLLKWQDSPCPVCRFDHTGLNESLSQCSVCGTIENNFICLICGVVSCGGISSDTEYQVTNNQPNAFRETDEQSSSPKKSSHSSATWLAASMPSQRTPIEHQQTNHARYHFQTTLHTYALHIQSQHVWDFAGDGWVAGRLINNIDDSKIVEVQDPSNTLRERSLNPGLSDIQEEEVIHRKLETFASEYHMLLNKHLARQRYHYDQKLEGIEKSSESGRKGKSTADLIVALRQEKNRLEQRCHILNAKHREVLNKVEFLNNMNESLQENKSTMRGQIMKVRKERDEARDMKKNSLKPLEEKVKNLMLQLENKANGHTKPSKPYIKENKK